MPACVKADIGRIERFLEGTVSNSVFQSHINPTMHYDGKFGFRLPGAGTARSDLPKPEATAARNHAIGTGMRILHGVRG